MSDTTPDTAEVHQRAEAPALIPTFTEPVLQQLPGVDAYARELQAAHEVTTAPTAAPPDATPRKDVTASGGAADGPTPVLAGTFALYVTPERAIVLAYRPEGANEDKQLMVPPFITEMAARQTGHRVEDILSAIGGTL